MATKKKQGFLAGLFGLKEPARGKSAKGRPAAKAGGKAGSKQGGKSAGKPGARPANSGGSSQFKRKGPAPAGKSGGGRTGSPRPAAAASPDFEDLGPPTSFEETLFADLGEIPMPEFTFAQPESAFAPEPTVQQAAMPAMPAPPPADGGGKLFSETLGDTLDALFDSFEQVGSAPATASMPPPQPAAPPSMAPPPPAPHHAAAAYPAPGPDSIGQGQAGALGKMLVDPGTLRRIIDNAERRGTGMFDQTRIIGPRTGAGLDQLLAALSQVNGVTGGLVVGRDGLVIAQVLSPDQDKDLIGAIASAIFLHVDAQTRKIGHEGLRQAILETASGVLLLREIEVGVLVLMGDPGGLDLAGALDVVASFG